jgi:hypothetical protein
VKLVFPVKEGSNWVGDAYNNRITGDSLANLPQKKEHYYYNNVGNSFDVNGLNFSKTVTVLQGEPYKNVQLNSRQEVYAEGIGKVYRLFNRVVYCEGSEINSDCQMGVEWKQSGHERHEVLVAHGKL